MLTYLKIGNDDLSLPKGKATFLLIHPFFTSVELDLDARNVDGEATSANHFAEWSLRWSL